MKRAYRFFLSVICTSIILCIIYLLSLQKIGKEVHGSLLRLNWRATDNKIQICRAYTDEEKASIPQHMQTKEMCENKIVPYDLTVLIDGQLLFKSAIEPKGARKDHPLIVDLDMPLTIGKKQITLHFTPQPLPSYPQLTSEQLKDIKSQHDQLKDYSLVEDLTFDDGKIILIDLDETKTTFKVLKN